MLFVVLYHSEENEADYLKGVYDNIEQAHARADWIMSVTTDGWCSIRVTQLGDFSPVGIDITVYSPAWYVIYNGAQELFDSSEEVCFA